MDDNFDWSVTTWEGSRRRQHQEYLALTFREKLQALEEMENLARTLGSLRDDRSPPDQPSGHGTASR